MIRDSDKKRGIDFIRKVNAYAQKINAPLRMLPTFEQAEGDGTPYCTLDTDGYHYIISERGKIYEDFVTKDECEIIYKIFSIVTFNMACKYELDQRHTNNDPRRIIFEKQLELLGLLSEDFKKRERKRIEQVLEKYPFIDKDNVT